jgi:beta-galactosidase
MTEPGWTGLTWMGMRTWEAPELISVNRLAMRSPMVPFADVETARTGNREASPWFRSLNGTWRFRLVDRPEDIPSDFAEPNLHDGLSSGWKPIEVPGNWTVQGWDKPIYTNVRMPWGDVPPRVPAANPTGLYRNTFTVPREWKGRRIVLHVGGAESVLYVWVNGRAVGMAKDSRLPSEFDVTDQVRLGANTLACAVVRWSDASYLEDQDQWWHGGIHREVALYATGPVRIDDVRVHAGLADEAIGEHVTPTGTLRVRATIGFETLDDRRPGWRIEARVETLDGTAMVRDPLVGEVPHEMKPYLFSGHVVRLEASIPGVRPWSAEQPELYRLIISLIDPHGIVHEVVYQRIGFRTVEVRDRQLLVNGAPVMIHGVNRHDHHPERGKAVTVDDMRDDLITMKRFNVNAVRCSHYPNDSRFLDLCDELGLYVIDEANVESHAYITSLCHDPSYRQAIIERVSRMVERDKNHPCVIAWSLGNESGHGAAQDAAAAWVRRYDPTRPLHYESALMFDLYADAGVTDIVCPMYASIEDIVAWAESGRDQRRPLILCEYSHAMGNSNGSLADYYAAFEAHDGLQGGFIWEWKDHGLLQHLDEGKQRYAYGGQFGDEPNDANFVADGLVGPDGRPHPALYEFAHLAAPVRVTATRTDLRGKTVTIENRQWFTDLSWLRATWELTLDGERVLDGTLPLPAVAARQQAKVAIDFDRPKLGPGQEAHLTVRVLTGCPTDWATEGHEVARAQFEVGRKPLSRKTKEKDGAADQGSVEADGDRLIAGPLELTVSESGLGALRWHGHELLTEWPRLSLWRAPTDNDGLKLFLDRDDGWTDERAKPLARWLGWGLDQLRTESAETDVAHGAGRAEITVRHRLVGSDPARPIEHRRRITLLAAGDIIFDEEVRVPEEMDDLPRVGIVFVTAPGFDRLEWLGLGPLETYPDRRAAATVGRWESTVSDQYVSYVMPQEHGLHLDTRWMVLGGGDDQPSLLVVGDGTRLAFSAGHLSADDLWKARDTTELEPRAGTVVHLDVAHRGLGTLSCGPDVLPPYRVGGGVHRWRWRLRPFSSSNETPAALARQTIG